eukprot:gene1558-32940_t
MVDPKGGSSSTGRSWDELLATLGSLIAFRKRADANGWRDAFENMPVYMQRIGLDKEIDSLSIIHVAGTKGKGSTCAMVESILRQSGYRTGLFTSPHLIDVRERVRINGEMVSKDVFESHFWDCYNKLEATSTPTMGIPGYFRFLTILALRIFVSQQVDVVILEVGVGGRVDATNAIPSPVVCGITSLGLDHIDQLGDTIEECARAVDTSLEVVSPLDSFKTISGGVPQLGIGGKHQLINAGLAVRLASTWEKVTSASSTNKSAIVGTRLDTLGRGLLPPVYELGLANVAWPGRSQIVAVHEFAVLPFPDSVAGSTGARTLTDSIVAVDDFAVLPMTDSVAGSTGTRALTDSVAGSTGARACRAPDPSVLLTSLASGLAGRNVHISGTFFVLPVSQYGVLKNKKDASSTSSTDGPDLSWQRTLQQVWQEHCAPIMMAVNPPEGVTSLPPAPVCRQGSRIKADRSYMGVLAPSLTALVQLQVLVTGSLYLVGDVLGMLGNAPH